MHVHEVGKAKPCKPPRGLHADGPADARLECLSGLSEAEGSHEAPFGLGSAGCQASHQDIHVVVHLAEATNHQAENRSVLTQPLLDRALNSLRGAVIITISFTGFLEVLGLDPPLALVDRLLPKTTVSEIIDIVFRFCGQKTTVIFCDKLKDLGFKHAFKAGISFGKDDLVIPQNKTQLIDDTKKLIADYETQYAEGLITRGEKYNKVVDAWSKCTDKVAGEMMKGISATERLQKG